MTIPVERRSQVSRYALDELDAAINAGADETTQALVWAGLRGSNVIPKHLHPAVVKDVLARYRRWQMEEATAPDVLARDLALLYGPEKE